MHSKTIGYRPALILTALSLAVPASAQTILPSISHWGASMFPTLAERTQIGITTYNFTQFDGNRRQYGLQDADSALIRAGLVHPILHYQETSGPVLGSISHSGFVGGRNSALNNLYFRLGLGLGVQYDPFPRWLQNQIIHLGYLNIDTVPRGKVTCEGELCPEYSVAGELNYRFPNIIQDHDLRIRPTPLFFGIGGSMNSMGTELYAQTGVKDIKLFPRFFDGFAWWGQPVLGIKVNAMSRLGILWNQGFTRRFRKLNPGYVISQAGFDLVILPKYYPISVQNLVTAHSGIFLDSRNQAIRELLWSLRISLGDFHFEQANDLINGKDAGPTFLAGVYFDLPQNWAISRWTSRMSDKFLSDWD